MTKPIIFTYATDANHLGLAKLVSSLKKFNWDYEVILEPKWKGFGRKVKTTIEAARKVKDKYTHCFFVDAYDVLMQGPPEDFVTPSVPLLISTEENCWQPPQGITRENYPKGTSIWQFAHAQYILDLNYCDLMRAETILDTKDDQQHCHELYFNNPRNLVQLDYDCKYLLAIAFCLPWDKYFDTSSGRVYNKLTNTYPLAVHGNGKTDMSWVPGY